jgi:hypothetical protein
MDDFMRRIGRVNTRENGASANNFKIEYIVGYLNYINDLKSVGAQLTHIIEGIDANAITRLDTNGPQPSD